MLSEIPLKKINIGICGLGTVASGVVNVLQRNENITNARAGCELTIQKIGARRDNPSCDVSQYNVSRNIFDVIDDPDVDIVIELIGGTDTAKDIVMRAIAAGKHVVTANKALIAEHGNEILLAAKKQQVTVAFEAAVAGGIPIIKVLTEGLSANIFESIAGIINGTGNYILTEMREKQRSFKGALADAQALGYAEADPTYDVEGIDAAQKLVILAALAFGGDFDVSACYIEGITNVQPEDIIFSDALGYRIKHLGIARQTALGLELRVHPALIPQSRLIANVDGVMNAVFVKGDAVGSTLYYGPGAGSEPTASAVIADVVDIAKRVAAGCAEPQAVVESAPITHVDIGNIESAYYLRVTASNEAGALSQITQLLSEANISVEAMRQQEHSTQADATNTVPIVLVTNTTREANLREAIAKIEQLTAVTANVVVLRIEPLD